MPRGYPTTLTIHLTPEERQTIEAWQRSPTIPAALARRGRVLLLRSDGMPIAAIVARVRVSRRSIYTWLRRFLQAGLVGLADMPGRGQWRRPRPPA